MHTPSQWLQHFSVESIRSVSQLFCSLQWSVPWDYRKVGLLICECACANTTAVPVKMKWRGSNRNSRTLEAGSNRNSRTSEAGSHTIDKSHMHEKALSNLLPFDDTEVNWMYTYWFYRPIPNVNRFLVFSGNSHTCTSSWYQAIFSPPTWPRNEASGTHAYQ